MSLKSHIISSVLISFVLKFVFIKTNEIIILPFNSSFVRGSSSGFSFMDDLQERNLYTIINIGEPENEIKAILTMQSQYLSLVQNHYIDKTNSYNKYNITKSSTFKNISCPNQYFVESNNDILAEEKIKIKKYNYQNNIYSDIVLNNINIILGVNKQYKDNTYLLNIGFQIIIDNKNLEKEKYSFISQLKSRKIINNYYWCIYFDRGNAEKGNFLYNPDELLNARGRVVIGDLPSNYQPKNFHISQLLNTYSYGKDNILTWAIEFNSIYYYDKNNKTVKDNYNKVHININNFIVSAPTTYKYHIEQAFFKQYLNRNICHIYSGIGYDSFYCDKSENFTINDLKQFPTLYLQNNELQYIFGFDYEDLFVEKDNKYWFLVTFPTFVEVEEWFFGIIFLRKYNLIFNQDSKTISFYNPNLPIIDNDSSRKINNNSNDKTYIIIIVIIIVIIISIGIGIYIGKMVYENKKGKKRLNELDDSFEYDSKLNQEEKNGNNVIGI